MRGVRVVVRCAILVVCAWTAHGAARADGDGDPPAKKPAAEGPSLADRAGAAIDRGVVYLKSRQQDDGSWGTMYNPNAKNYGGGDRTYDFPAGPTAFALYTLLKCEVPPDDPVIQKGFAVLKKLLRDETSTYEIAAAVLAVEAKYDQVKREQKREAAAGLAADPGKRPNLSVKPSREDAAWLKKLVGALDDRFADGGWRYFRPTGEKARGAREDTSATAMAMLAALAAHRCGVELPRKTLLAAVKWTLEEQDSDGPPAAEALRARKDSNGWTPPEGSKARGWAYVRRSPLEGEPTTTTGNMTTAGLITLLAAQHVLEDTSPDALKRLQPDVDAAIRDGVAWLGVHWTVKENPGSDDYLFMYLYGLERVGDLRRVGRIAGHDWYTEGAEQILRGQSKDGRWERNDTHPPRDVVNTCFALLFLDRASLAVTTPK